MGQNYEKFLLKLICMTGINMFNAKLKNCSLIENRAGFTMVELLIALSIFVIVMGLGLSMYLSINRIQKKNLRANLVYSETRYWMDMLVDEIQSFAVHYDSNLPYPAMPYPEDELLITNAEGKRVRYYLDDTDLDGFNDTLKRQTAISPPVTLSSPEIKMTRLHFYVDPLAESGTDLSRVTIIMQAKDVSTSSPIVVNLQTTVGSRSY